MEMVICLIILVLFCFLWLLSHNNSCPYDFAFGSFDGASLPCR
jgi:hypothetical protein